MCVDGDDDLSVSGDSAQVIAPMASYESNGRNVNTDSQICHLRFSVSLFPRPIRKLGLGTRLVLDLLCMHIHVFYSPSFTPPPSLLSTTPPFSLFPILSLRISVPLTSPDAPRIMLDGDILSWEAPNDRGSPITGYRITAM